jgi:hypothetical protein
MPLPTITSLTFFHLLHSRFVDGGCKRHAMRHEALSGHDNARSWQSDGPKPVRPEAYQTHVVMRGTRSTLQAMRARRYAPVIYHAEMCGDLGLANCRQPAGPCGGALLAVARSPRKLQPS